MDTDPQPDPTDSDEQSAPSSSEDTESPAPSDAAPEEDEASGAATTTDEPAASDAYGNPDDHVGDFTTPDVDLSHLTPASDGDPDDEEPPAETVDQTATGQAVVSGEEPQADPEPFPQVTPEEPTA